ncbi:CHAT domain-containing protein [Nostoc sp. UCD121]|uniref:CHAT domain-containing protein n=1 Tax=unclassified Nostoc TaxID=2593658 RepID=UPI001628A045|nr:MULTISPECIES: CHAT domain-containing protein [unclassified Nostoc]MBC1225200.1 CHAT domain-containing protein [Nostoc sp. UCD120]MBC1280271.1 CHAT domain-containing protein [Nostoc sp. UCD121]
MKTFADFEVWIGLQTISTQSRESTSFPVQVLSSPAGPATGDLELDLSADDFKSELIQIQGIDPDEDLRKSFGSLLFKALFKRSVGEAWANSRGRVGDGVLRLRLWINVPHLAALPWEMLWDGQQFLATSANIPVTRYLPVPEPPVFTLTAQERLKILVVIESPQGVPQIDSKETEYLDASLKGLDKVEYKILQNSTLSQIQDELQHNYHVLHFLGHGTGGKLVLTDDNGQSKRIINDREFAQLFLGRASLRLIVLNACNSSQDKNGLFSGIAPSLVEKSIPAVIAMQYPFVQLDTASLFSRRFYGSLANGLPIDVAVNEARQFLSVEYKLGSRDWNTPILYMGTRSNNIFKFLSDETSTLEQAWLSVQEMAQKSDESKAALKELSQTFQEIAISHQKLSELIILRDYLNDFIASFHLCVNIVEQAGGTWANLQFDKLKKEWKRVQQNDMDKLKIITKKHIDNSLNDYFLKLVSQSKSIDFEIDRGAYSALANGVISFEERLSQFENVVSEDLNQTIKDLVVLSERTLGRLEMTS